jgi:hypothetical protein
MYKTLVGLVITVITAAPASAQNYNKNFIACAKEIGLNLDPSYTHKLSDGRIARRWYLHSEAQQAVFNDCLARKANLATPSSSKRALPVSR